MSGRGAGEEKSKPMTPKIDVIVDCRGLHCPMPILKIKEASDRMASGQVMEVLATDAGAERSVDAWSRHTGNEVLGVENDGEVFRFCIQKK